MKNWREEGLFCIWPQYTQEECLSRSIKKYQQEMTFIFYNKVQKCTNAELGISLGGDENQGFYMA